MRYLHIKPRGGLANRLRALASAMWVADELGIPLVLTWPYDHAITIPFEKIFTNAFDQDSRKLMRLSTVHFKNPRFIDFSLAKDDTEDKVYEIVSNSPFSHLRESQPYTTAFWTRIRPYLLQLNPVMEVEQLVHRVSSTFSPNMLGVHVRTGMGDVPFTQSNFIKTKLFFSEIDRILNDEADTHLFLASDSVSVIEDFLKHYGPIVTTIHGKYSDVLPGTASTVEGLQIALSDLLLLSKTKRILGSCYSSFSKMASIIGARPLKQIGRYDDRSSVDSDFALFVKAPFATRVNRRVRRALQKILVHRC